MIFSSQNHQSYSISLPTHSTRRRHHRHLQSYLVDIIIIQLTPTSVLFFILSTSSSCRRHRHLISSMYCRHHHLVVDIVIWFLLCIVDIITFSSTLFSSFFFFLLFANPNLLLFSPSLILLTDKTKTRLNHTSQHPSSLACRQPPFMIALLCLSKSQIDKFFVIMSAWLSSDFTNTTFNTPSSIYSLTKW